MFILRSVDDELSQIAQTLWDLDENRAKWNEDFTIDLQSNLIKY
jgi:hypothetical protein